MFFEHPIAWLINNYYFLLYLKYNNDGNILFAVNYRNVYSKQSEFKPDHVANNIKKLIDSHQEKGLSLQYLLGSYRKQYGEFPKDINHTLSDYLKKANVFVAYYPQELSGLRVFKNRFMYFENIKLGIKNHCNNKNYDGYISTKKIYQLFGIPSMTFLTNFFNDFEFVSQWNARNGSRDIYVKNVSQKRYNMIYNIDWRNILDKNNGYVFLADLNNQCIKHFGATMDERIIIHKHLTKLPNIHYLPWNYSFSEHSNRYKDKQSMNYCDEIVFDINNPNIASIVQIPILVKLFRYDFDNTQRLLSNKTYPNTLCSSSTNYRDHLVTQNAFKKHLQRHAKLKHAQNEEDWNTFLKPIQRENIIYYALNHDAILNALRTTFMGEIPQIQTDSNETEVIEAQNIMNSNDIYQKLDDIVNTFETKLDKVWNELQQRQSAVHIIDDDSKNIIDDNAHLQLIGNKKTLNTSSNVSFLNTKKSATSKQSLSVFGEETLKAMLLDCCKSGYSKPSINIAVYMAQNNMLCNTEHYIGLMRIQYDALAKEIWKEMIQRHFIVKDTFSITMNTFQAMRQALDDTWFKTLLLHNVQRLSTHSNDVQNEEIMLVFLKYIQEYSQENLAEWFSYHVKINQHALNSIFWKKAALMLAVVFSKNASRTQHNHREYNDGLQRCLDPWLNNTSKDKWKSSFISDASNLNQFLSQQLEQLIMRVSNSSELMNVNTLKKLLKLYASTLSSNTSSSHIVRDRLQYICLTVLQQQKEPISTPIMKLLESARLNTQLFMNAADDANSENIYEYEKVMPSSWIKTELLTSFANKGDVESLLSSIESLNKLLEPSMSQQKKAKYEDVRRQHLIFLRESINKFLNNCGDINLAFVMMDKLLRCDAGQSVMHFGYFLRMIDIGINNKNATSHWFQIKHLLQLMLDIPYKTIWRIEIYEKLINYCLIHEDIVGLTDALQMLFDYELYSEDKLSSQLFEQIMQFIANKSSDAALHLFERLLKYSEKPTFKCLYCVLKACADRGDAIGVETVKDLMIANGINKDKWNIDIYNAMIQSHSFNGDEKIEESLCLFNELLSNGLKPNTDTFNALLSHHRKGVINVDFMLHQINEMKSFNVSPSQHTFSIILEYCAKHKHKEIAKQLLHMIGELPSDERSDIINNKSVWLNYIQCFDNTEEIYHQMDEIFKSYKSVVHHFITNNVFQHIIRVNHDIEHGSIANTLTSLSNIEWLIQKIVGDYDNNCPLSLDMNAFCKVFDVIYRINKSEIINDESKSNLNEINNMFWRFMDTMKDLNIFFPDPDLLKPYLYLKDIELGVIKEDKYEHIVDGIFQFIEYGVFVSPQLIQDLCDNIGMQNNRSQQILETYNDRCKYQQNLRLKQPLPKFS